MATQSKKFSDNYLSYLLDLIFLGFGVLMGLAMALAGLILWLDYQADPTTSPLALMSAQSVTLLPGAATTYLEQQAQLMGLPLTANTQAYWFMARAGGIIAYLLLWFATAWGIVMSSKIARGVIDGPMSYGLHEFFPLLATVFAALHAIFLLGDSYINFTMWHLLIPFISPYEPLWTGLGVIALYLCIALLITTALRRRMGHKPWRIFHYAAYLAFVLALLHGAMAGTDTQFTVIKGMYLFTGLSVLFLTYYRLLTMGKRRRA